MCAYRSRFRAGSAARTPRPSAGPYARRLAAALLCALAALAAAAGAESAPRTIHFFSPESSINNFSTLKNEFDRYLARFGDLQLQPFKNRADFDRVLGSAKPGVFLMSAWHFQAFPQRDRLEPVLVGVGREHRATETRNLWARKQAPGIESLRGSTVATAGSVEYSKSLLRELLGGAADDLLPTITLLVVPKDIDALMAVSFGTAAAALASECASEKLAEIGPQQLSALRELARGRPSLRLLVVVPREHREESSRVIDALREMGSDPEGRRRLNMIGLHGLRDLEPVQREELTP